MSVGNIGSQNVGLTAQASPRPHRNQDAKTSHSQSTLTVQNSKNSAAALQGQIRVAREQLNDWVTCVSATTPKGQAEIRSLSAQISAAQEHISRLQQSSAPSQSGPSASATGSKLDVWA